MVSKVAVGSMSTSTSTCESASAMHTVQENEHDDDEYTKKIHFIMDDEDDFREFMNVVQSFKSKEILESTAILQLTRMIQHKFIELVLGLNRHLDLFPSSDEGFQKIEKATDGQLFYRSPVQKELVPLLPSVDAGASVRVKMQQIEAELNEARFLLRDIREDKETAENTIREQKVANDYLRSVLNDETRKNKERKGIIRDLKAQNSILRKHVNVQVESKDRQPEDGQTFSKSEQKILREIGLSDFDLNSDPSRSLSNAISNDEKSADESEDVNDGISNVKVGAEASGHGSDDVYFNTMLQQLETFKAKYGHLRVTEKDDESLAKFCSKIRRAYRDKRMGHHNTNATERILTAERIRSLRRLGFDFDPRIIPGGRSHSTRAHPRRHPTMSRDPRMMAGEQKNEPKQQRKKQRVNDMNIRQERVHHSEFGTSSSYHPYEYIQMPSPEINYSHDAIYGSFVNNMYTATPSGPPDGYFFHSSPPLLESNPAQQYPAPSTVSPSVIGNWKDYEDAFIIGAVMKCKEPQFNNWKELAKRLPGRAGKQIRDRWVNYLNPNINHRPFTKKDDMKLWEAHKQLGRRFTIISTKFFKSSRSENQIKNRLNSVAFQQFVVREFGPDALRLSGIKTSKRKNREDEAQPQCTTSSPSRSS